MTAICRQQITVLGSTGSIGVSTLDVIARHLEQYQVFALTAHTSVDTLAIQCQQFNPRYAVVGDAGTAEQLRKQLTHNRCQSEVLYGVDALEQVARAPEADTVMAAIVGAAGLMPTMAAVRAGKKVLLANKEALVMASTLFMAAVATSGAQLLPIDSEHNAMFQCLPAGVTDLPRAGISKLLLTGSGGPFRTWSDSAIHNATPEQACNHPNWSMGRKISVDSATLMNKGLELIEACSLFNVPPSSIQVVIHPQSVIHSMVEYVDGSILAQLGNPDMRTPIAHALAWPERIASGVSSLDIVAAARLDFEEPDLERFPALALAMAAAKQGNGAPTVLNAANEVAVAAFLERRISFGQIAQLLTTVMNLATMAEPADLFEVQALDQYARRIALEQMPQCVA